MTTTSRPTALDRSERRAPVARERARFALALLAFFVIHLAIDAALPLVPDEAVYWSWSRHPAPGYLDHPPMVAWLIAASARLFGHTPLGVRFPATLTACGAVAVMLWIARRVLRDDRQAAWAAGLLLVSPMLAVLATITTPDTPAIFFSVCATACAVAATDDDRPRRTALAWVGFGLFTGLALLTKYTAVLLPASVALALLTTPAGRSHMRRPWVYVAAVVAALVFVPVLHWNYRHGWASFRFQLHHGLSTADAAADLDAASAADRGGGGAGAALSRAGLFVAGQMGLWNPVLMALGVLAVAWHVRRYHAAGVPRQLLVWGAAVPLLFFGAATTRARGEMNWPDFAYFPLAVLTVAYAFAEGEPAAAAARRRKWLRTGAWVAGASAVAVSLPTLLVRAHVRPAKFDELYGWPEFARALDARRHGLPVVAATQREAGELSFYLPGHPHVWVAPAGAGGRASAFDYMDDRPDFRAAPGLVFVGKHAEGFCRAFGLTPVGQDTIAVPLPTGRRRVRTFHVLRRNGGADTSGAGEVAR